MENSTMEKLDRLLKVINEVKEDLRQVKIAQKKNSQILAENHSLLTEISEKMCSGEQTHTKPGLPNKADTIEDFNIIIEDERIVS